MSLFCKMVLRGIFSIAVESLPRPTDKNNTFFYIYFFLHFQAHWIQVVYVTTVKKLCLCIKWSQVLDPYNYEHAFNQTECLEAQ